jgi:hypothetical protein
MLKQVQFDLHNLFIPYLLQKQVNMNLFEIEQEYLAKKLDGMSFSDIRKQLVFKGLSDEQIKVVIRSIDNKIIHGAVSKSNKSIANQFIYMGLSVTGLGLLITIGTYTGFISMGNSYLLCYGPILGGLGILAMGFNKR